MNIQELKETWLRRIKTLNEEIGKEEPGTEKMIRLIAKRSVYQYELVTLDQLEATHQSEIHDLERKAWECSENLILGHIAKELKDEIEIGRQVNLAKTIMKSLRIGEAFGFPKSETPDRFKK
jgi:hypothetical protein